VTSVTGSSSGRLRPKRPTRRIILFALAATLVAVAVGSASIAAASSASDGVKTLRYGVTFVNDSEFDLGARGPSTGDERTFYDVLSDRSGKRVGYNGGVCAVENVKPPVFSCSLTISLPGGQIATQS
jgi:hypothetical protein